MTVAAFPVVAVINIFAGFQSSLCWREVIMLLVTRDLPDPAPPPITISLEKSEPQSVLE